MPLCDLQSVLRFLRVNCTCKVEQLIFTCYGRVSASVTVHHLCTVIQFTSGQESSHLRSGAIVLSSSQRSHSKLSTYPSLCDLFKAPLLPYSHRHKLETISVAASLSRCTSSDTLFAADQRTDCLPAHTLIRFPLLLGHYFTLPWRFTWDKS